MEKKFVSNFLKGSAATSIGTVSSIFFHFLSIMIMTRHIPKEDFGIYILILVIVSIFNLLSALGLEISIVKFVSSAHNSEKKQFVIPIILMRAISLLAFIIIFYSIGHLIVPLFNERINQFIIYIPVMFFLNSFRELFYNLIQGLKLFKKYALIQVLSAILRISLLLLILYLNALNLKHLIYIEIIISFQTLICQLSIIPLKDLLSFRQKKRTYQNIIKFSTPLYFNSMLGFLRERVNVFIVGALLNPVSVAYYDIATRIPDGLGKIFQSFIIVYFPNSSTLFSQGKKEEAQNLMNKSLGILSIGIAFIVLVSFIFRNEIILLIFSNEYLPSSMAFSLLMMNFYFRAISSIMGYSLVAAGHSSIPVKVNSVASVVNLICSITMIPIIGFIGAVYSLMVMNLVSQFIYYLYLLKSEIFPNVIVYLKVLFIFLITIGLYLSFQNESIWVKLIFLVFNLMLYWLFIEEFRFASNFALTYIQKLTFKKRVFNS